jgi:hypothetical protein
MIVANKAPAFPINADIPWHVPRSSVGYVSAAMTYEVTFGPKFTAKLLKKYRNISTCGLVLLNIDPVSRKMKAQTRKEIICSFFRPTLGLSMTFAAQ